MVPDGALQDYTDHHTDLRPHTVQEVIMGMDIEQVSLDSGNQRFPIQSQLRPYAIGSGHAVMNRDIFKP